MDLRLHAGDEYKLGSMYVDKALTGVSGGVARACQAVRAKLGYLREGGNTFPTIITECHPPVVGYWVKPANPSPDRWPLWSALPHAAPGTC